MIVLPNGYLSETFSSTDLVKGLRTTQHNPRNSRQLTKCQGAIGYKGVLKTLEVLEISSIMNDPNIIADDFPFPQLFVLDNHILICNRQSILELQDINFVVAISGLDAGGKWNVLSSHDFIYLTNGVVSILKDPGTKTYSISSTAPIASAVCNFNGQCIVGNPN